MRCRRREGPWGSHHDEARVLKWDTSEGSMLLEGLGVVEVVRLAVYDFEKERKTGGAPLRRRAMVIEIMGNLTMSSIAFGTSRGCRAFPSMIR
jgi:hypothetical protein